MADNEIQILIKAVDEFSTTLKKIETNTGKTFKEVEKSTESVGQSFTKLQGNLLVLGNAAASVDRIFDSYQNLQLRLENSTERVANATDRLSDAQKKYDRLVASGTASAEELEDAQTELTRATRGLNIAQNNLAKTQNAVIGTYISIGTQVLVLIGSIPTLISTVATLGKTLWALVPALTSVTIAGAPLWAIVLAISAAIVGVILVIKHWEEITNALGVAWNWLSENVLQPIWSVMKEIGKWLEFIFLPQIIMIKLGVEALGIAFTWLWHEILEPVYQWLKDTFLGVLNSVIDAMKWIIDNISKVANFIGEKVSSGVSKVSSGYKNIAGQRDVVVSTAKSKFSDFIQRPGQDPISFSPDDTLIGLKNPKLGTTINIEVNGPIYGMNPKDISIALKKELSHKMTI